MSYVVVYGRNLCLTFASRPEAFKSFFSIVRAHANAQIFAVSGSHFTNLTTQLIRAQEKA